MKLSEKKCIPCEGGVPTLSKLSVKKYLKQLRGWKADSNKSISKEFKFKNFIHTMGFVNQVSMIAQAENHHPDMHVHYSKVVIELSTHEVGGLTENDFILAAKIDQIK